MKNRSNDTPATKRPVRTGPFASLRGLWRSRGYGQILDIGPEIYTVYEETGLGCIPVFEGPLAELAEHYVDVSVSPAGLAFGARRATGVTRLKFRRLKKMPRSRAVHTRSDPAYNFEVLWHTFAEQYALFEVRDVNWQAVYDQYRSKIDQGVSQSELFHIMAEALQPLGDGHVQLHTPHGRFNAAGEPPLYQRIAAELDRAEDSRDLPSYFAELREGLREMIHDEYLEDRARHGGNRLLEWGALDGAAGYLAIRAMAGQSGKVGRPREDLEAVDAAMPRIMAELGEYPVLVVDLRVNGGGYDGVALRLASYLIDRKRLAFTKAARRGEGFTGQHPVYVEPRGPQRYTGRLIVLTSGLTASAAEVFVLALLQHPQLTLVGEPTQGILSDAMERHLPNGWFFTLSNELYRAANGELYEDSGIPPHVEIPFLPLSDRESKRDGMLDYVLRLEDT